MKKLWIAVALILSLTGCAAPSPAGQSRMVVGITLTRDGQSRHYIRQDCLARVLNYVRCLDPYGKAAEDPEALPGEDFRIRLEYSDGSEKNYRQKARRYLRLEDQPWKQIDPEQARELNMLFEVLPECEGFAPVCHPERREAKSRDLLAVIQ